MPKIRIGLSTDFNLVGEQVGIGTTNPTARLDVAGQILADNTAGSGGISTFKEYQGFHQTQSNITNNVLIDNGSSGPFSSLSGEIRITGETTVSSGSTVEVGKTKTLTVTDKFAVPFGDTNSRDNTPEAGTTRFNQDFGTLEFFDGTNWKTVNSYARGGAAGRVIYAGGNNSGSSPHTLRNIEFFNAMTKGNASLFGDLTESVRNKGSGSSSTRGVFGNGASPNNTTNTDVIEYITIASEGNSIDFGDSTAARRNAGGTSNSTRFLMIGGYVSAASDVIDYVEISTIGDALDFGDLRIAKYYPAGISSPIRAVFAGGTSPGNSETMSFVSIASKGDSTNFGDLSSGGGTYQSGGPSDGVRGILGGVSSPNNGVLSYIENITIASEGNTTQFGNLSVARNASGASGGTRGIFAGGGTSPSSTYHNIIDYVTIASAGDAIDFGDISHASSGMAGLSDSHGGLGGF